MKIELIEVINDDQITIAEVKEALRITGTGHISEIEAILDASRSWVENIIDTTIGKKSWKLTADEEYDENELPFGPVLECEKAEDYIYEYTAGFDGGVIPPDIKRLILLCCKRHYDLDDLGQGVNDEISRLILTNTRNPGL